MNYVKFKVKRGKKSSLNASPVEEGELKYCTDTGEMYIDNSGSHKIILGKDTDISTLTISGNANKLIAVNSAGNGLVVKSLGRGINDNSNVIGHSNTITAGNIGQSAATSGNETISIPYASYDANGHITGTGTRTHTINAATTTTYGVIKVGSGLSMSSGVLNHSNSVTANTTNGLKSFAVDAQGHTTAYTVKSLGRGLNESSNVIGHSNTAITASTTNGLKSFAVDAYGHVTAYTVKSLGNGLTDSSNVIGHSNSVTAGTAGTGSISTIPIIKWDAQGHITSITTANNTNTGSSNTTSKLFLVGATSQTTTTTTYSNSAVYATNGALRATTYNVADKVRIEFNATTNTIDFVFL